MASRCADSFSIRGYLGYSLTEATPEHSSLSVLRERLSLEQRAAIHGVLLAARHAHGLLKGRKLGIDSSVIEANTSLCERVLAAVGTLCEALPEQPPEKFGRERCGDEGYFSIEQIAQLQECAVRTLH